MGSQLLPAVPAEQLIELAKQSGAQAAEVFQSQSLSRPVLKPTG